MLKPKIWWAWAVLVGTLIVYACWSWIPTAPNTFLFTADWFINWQMWLWQNFTPNHQLLVGWYLLLMILMFGSYVVIIKLAREDKLSFSTLKTRWWLVGGVIVPLLLAFNVLSFDVFNYGFNAKMVVEYGSDPHTQVAQDFIDDPWLKFMHNVHTSAPYGYGWTLLSLIPFVLTGGKLVLLWLSFRLGSVMIIVGTLVMIVLLAKKTKRHLSGWLWLLLALNPLVLVELVANTHNDWWMMLPVLGAIYCWWPKPQLKWQQIAVGSLLLLLSISIKFATLALAPLLLVLLITKWQPGFLSKWRKLIMANWFALASLLLLLPLFTPRSQLFHPWYLTWSLAFLPLVEQKWVRQLLVIMSLSSLLRYLPYLYIMGYDSTTLGYQQLITWSLPVGYLLIVGGRWGWRWLNKKKTHGKNY